MARKKKKYNYEDRWLYGVSGKGKKALKDVEISRLIRLKGARLCTNPNPVCKNVVEKGHVDQNGLCPNCWK